jgi:threonine dehydrogenase-like Zn-dependent dehydrogenase
LLSAYAARAATPASVTLLGTNDDEQVRFPRLRNLGFKTINIQQADIAEVVDERTNGRGADVVFDATGVPTGLQQGLSMTRKGGRIVVIGTPADPGSLDIASLVRSETDILGSYSARLRDFRRAMTLLRDYVEVASLVTQYDIDEPTKPMDDMLNNQAIKPLFSFE